MHHLMIKIKIISSKRIKPSRNTENIQKPLRQMAVSENQIIKKMFKIEIIRNASIFICIHPALDI